MDPLLPLAYPLTNSTFLSLRLPPLVKICPAFIVASLFNIFESLIVILELYVYINPPAQDPVFSKVELIISKLHSSRLNTPPLFIYFL